MPSPYIFSDDYVDHPRVEAVVIPGLVAPVYVTRALATRLRELLAAGEDAAARTLVAWLKDGADPVPTREG